MTNYNIPNKCNAVIPSFARNLKNHSKRFFVEFILSEQKRFFTSFRMTREGLRMTGFTKGELFMISML
ncbi:MAG: hypothetical protein A3B13_03670 [Candidatus Liptonbacteria bacterium RIFCSPLOWO2_01_FULL_45_15]|uniref:Uncharacterized protein n=1 Tax=Candidatus Liptonbacteria bacterium RIFCSPLOWO2_01_FULL_45_15 TaxID=1798649 RepID=A0A1G2CL77_9BACT|nr:MAG: hypothetical protein A3B13_03670 [Candidatus Liptonbacteria bacterium RIFCSPLOWO2_01_FULL_45_15]